LSGCNYNPLNNPQPQKTLDRKAFELLFQEHYGALGRFAAGYINDRESAEEIVQDVFVNLWQKRDSIDSNKPVKSYLYTSVKNRCLNYIRDNKKFRSQYLDIEAELEIPVKERDYFSEAYTEQKVKQALEKLPEKCREVFELNRFEGLKYQQLADKLGISVKTVEAQMSKALKILREELKDLILLILIAWLLLK
jgi:RNA polymerase sigma-70 factor, ECF subfamily